MDQSARSDFLSALVGSTLFWVTISGIAIRALKVDFVRLESFLTDAYKRADRFTFSVIETSEAAALKTLRALYGSHFLRIFAVTCLTSLVLNIYIVGLFHKEWLRRKGDIAVIERTTLSDLSPEYLAITRSPTADSDLGHAFEATSGRPGTLVYLNYGAKDVRIRATYDQFQRRIHDYALAKHIGHDLLLSRFFGDSFLYPAWRHEQWLQIGALFFLVCIANGLLDAIAVLATVFAVKAAFGAQLWRATLWSLLVAGCFLMSLTNYGQFVNGFEGQLFSLSLWFLVSAAAALLVGSLVVFTIKWVLSLSRVIKVAAILATLTAILGLWLRTGFLGRTFSLGWWSVPTEFVQNCAYILRNGIDVHAVMISMATLFPLLVVISVFATLMVAKGLLVLTKTVFLGEVYGASVVSGSTYFIGFLTTLITSTTVGFVLMKWLSHIRK